MAMMQYLFKALMQPLVGSDSICYVLGAGFSRANHPWYPLSKGFFAEPPFSIGSSVSDGGATSPISPSSPPEVIHRIKREYVGPQQRIEDLDLEDVMTDLFVRGYGLGRAWEAFSPPVTAGPLNSASHDSTCCNIQESRRAYQNLLLFVRWRLKSVDDLREVFPLAEKLAGSLRLQDSIITLNYDTLLERHLAKLSSDTEGRLHLLNCCLTPPGSTFGGPAPPMFRLHPFDHRGLLVKLHGSVDWFSCSNPSCAHHEHIEPSGEWVRYHTRRWSEHVRCQLCGSSPQVVMIPPIANKAIEQFPKLSLMWNNAYGALRKATRWTFIGVSLAVTDFHLASLLRAASRQDDTSSLEPLARTTQICIVNKDEAEAKAVGERLLRMLSSRLQERVVAQETKVSVFDSLEEYLEVVERLDSSREHATPPEEKVE